MKKPTAKSDPKSTQRADAKALGVTPRTLRNWRDAGCPGFRPDGTIADRAAVGAWAEAQLAAREGSRDAKEEKLMEEIRKLRMANDAKEGRLVERAWVAERMQRASGALNQYRAKSEAEHPMKFAVAAGDPAKCREIVRQIWSDIFSEFQALAKNFE